MNDEARAARQSGGVNLSCSQANIGRDIVGRDQITINQYGPSVAAATALAPHQLPPPPRDFTGRKEELDELRAAIEKGGVTISGLQGLGGVGKTALALKLADELKPRYPDAQFYLDLKGVSKEPVHPKDVMGHVIRSCRPEVKLPENEAELAGMYQTVLHGKYAILLMDNAKDANQVKPLIPPASCLFLVTSRSHFTLPGLAAKDLNALPPLDARELLIRIAPRLREERENYTEELVRLCGYLPQAIVPVGSALATRPDLKPENCIRKLTEARERLKMTEVDASLSSSYDLLEAELKKRFCALAVFPDAFDVTGAAAVWDLEPDPAQDSLSELVLYSLVDYYSATTRYRLHDLVRAFADVRLSSGDRMAGQKRHAEHYINVLGMAERLYLKGKGSLKEGLVLFDTEWRNVQAGQAWAAAHASDSDEVARLCSIYPGVGAWCLKLRQRPSERITWLEPALVAAHQVKDRRAEGAHLGNLGIVYDLLGEHRRAIEYYQQTLQLAREIGDRAGEGKTLGNIGIAYKNLGEYRRALDYHQKHLQIAQKMGDRRGEGTAMGNLGTAFFSSGEYRHAIKYYEQNLQILQEIGDRLGEGTAMGNLGLAYDSLGEYRRGIGYYEKQLAIAGEIGDRIGEANAHWNIGLTLHKLGNRLEAIAHAQEALKIYEQIESPHAAKVRERLAQWRA
jgi:tetratricopeptide (TPR) repeat protein